MANGNVSPRPDTSEVVNQFSKLLNTYKAALRVEVLDELINECYGPQPLLGGRPISDVTDLKEWLEAKLLEAKQKDEAA